MTQFVFIFLCALITTSFTAELNCDPDEVEDSCPADCKVDSCPKYENYTRQCEKPEKCPSPACTCRFNYNRAENGTCIPTTECPAFTCSRPNEEYVSCSPYCPTDDCSQATSDGECPLFGQILLVVECHPTCRCKKGYWRRDGVCVLYEDCLK